MNTYEYLPQLIIAYDGKDEYANLIHVSKADPKNNYYCPCCGGIVLPRAKDSKKEQSHYYHKTGQCTKESQLHFFCKNWLFEKGSKFYIENDLYEVDSIAIEKTWRTRFGDYRPDVTVTTTSGKIIYFEMFFTNRKTGDDYFCKWNYLGNDVVEIDIKEYMVKTDKDDIPKFCYLYHNGNCYSKPYVSRDLYANTIAKRKSKLSRQDVLNYRARIEQLDYFWEMIRNNVSKESILNSLTSMNHDDQVFCFDIIKRKQCVKYLKDDVKDLINQSVVEKVRNDLSLAYDENVYFDLECVHGRTYRAGIRLNIKTDHICYDKVINSYCDDLKYISGYPKVVFKRNIFDEHDIKITDGDMKQIQKDFNITIDRRNKILNFEKKISEYEKGFYNIRMNNDFYTVLYMTDDRNYKELFKNKYIHNMSIYDLDKEINIQLNKNECENFIQSIELNEKYKSYISFFKEYFKYGFIVEFGFFDEDCSNHFILKLNDHTIYDAPAIQEERDLWNSINRCKDIVTKYIQTYSEIIDIVKEINNCKNHFWYAKYSLNYELGNIEVFIDQRCIPSKKTIYLTGEKIEFTKDDLQNIKNVKYMLKQKMKKVIKNMEKNGYRVMEEV